MAAPLVVSGFFHGRFASMLWNSTLAIRFTGTRLTTPFGYAGAPIPSDEGGEIIFKHQLTTQQLLVLGV